MALLLWFKQKSLARSITAIGRSLSWLHVTPSPVLGYLDPSSPSSCTLFPSPSILGTAFARGSGMPYVLRHSCSEEPHHLGGEVGTHSLLT